MHPAGRSPPPRSPGGTGVRVRSNVRTVQELSFRGRDRYHPSWPAFAGVAVVVVVEGVVAAVKLGAVGVGWLVGGTVLLVTAGVWSLRHCRTAVGPEGITVSWGFGRGRTYRWGDIRWVHIRDSNSPQQGASRTARITLADGRRRSLPALQHSAMYPDPCFDANYERVVKWWIAATTPSSRFQPPLRPLQRMSPQTLGVLLGMVISVVIVGVVILVEI